MKLSGGIRRLPFANARKKKLPFPAGANLRIAQVTPFTRFQSVQSFGPERWMELEQYRPQVLVGPAVTLQVLAERVEANAIDLSSVDRAIFVLTECGSKPISDTLRVVFWQTFGVPVFELLTLANGEVYAAECEAHEGWHVERTHNASFVPAGLAGQLLFDECPCGRKGPRIMESAPPVEEVAEGRQLAAIA